MKFALEVYDNLTFWEVFLIIMTPVAFVMYWRTYFKQRAWLKTYYKRKEELEKNNCGKGNHSWIAMEVEGTHTHVCRKCNWCPDLEAYIQEFYVKAQIERERFLEGLEEYTKQRMGEISEKWEIDQRTLEMVATEITGIKQEFTVQYLEKRLEEAAKEIKC